MLPETTNMQDRINEALDIIRPYLQTDGGDVEFVDVSSSGDVTLRLTGACSVCEMSEMTMTAGIEETIRKSVPGIGKIIAIKE